MPFTKELPASCDTGICNPIIYNMYWAFSNDYRYVQKKKEDLAIFMKNCVPGNYTKTHNKSPERSDILKTTCTCIVTLTRV